MARIPAASDGCHRVCAYTQLQTFVNSWACINAYGALHCKKSVKSIEKGRLSSRLWASPFRDIATMFGYEAAR